MTNSTENKPVRFAKKSLGQNFLVDKNVVANIISAAGIVEGERVLEIGPGTGLLTCALLEAGAKVVAIEKDDELCKRLKQEFAENEDFTLIEADALEVDFIELSKKYATRLKVVSNLPYNISGPVMAKFLENYRAFSGFILMLQKEVAQRFAATSGTKAYGILSVLIRAYGSARMLFDVSPNSFKPRPKVTSTVVGITLFEDSAIPITDDALYPVLRQVVRAAFGQRRKTLLNALKALGCEPEVLTDALASVDIDPKRRGETLSFEEFLNLAKELSGKVPVVS